MALMIRKISSLKLVQNWHMLELLGEVIKIVTTVFYMLKKLDVWKIKKDSNQSSRVENYNV